MSQAKTRVLFRRAALMLYLPTLLIISLIGCQINPSGTVPQRRPATKPAGHLPKAIDWQEGQVAPSAVDVRQAIRQKAKEIELTVRGVTFSLLRIPPGEFEMGSRPGRPSDLELRRVRISKAFYLGRYEVTQLQYKTVMGETRFRFKGDSLAVQDVKYYDALVFCHKLSDWTGLPITLPTEAQWEYACRAGTTTEYCCGDSVADLNKVAWHRDNAGDTSHPGGQKQPNPWGLYDMHGNVWEPCADYIKDFTKLPATDPKGETRTSYGIMRGGGWMHAPEDCRASQRMPTSDMFGGMGIRIAINVPG